MRQQYEFDRVKPTVLELRDSNSDRLSDDLERV